MSHKRDASIAFLLPHDYHVCEKKVCPSVSSVAKHFFHEFDPGLAADAVLGSRAYREGLHLKYQGWTREQMMEFWKKHGTEAADLGTLMHSDIEMWLKEEVVESERQQLPEFQQFLDCYVNEIYNRGLRPYRLEWRIWDENPTYPHLVIPGTIDAVFVPLDFTAENPVCEIWDWKRSSHIDLQDKFGKKGFGPMADVDDCNYFHYALQLNLYRHILEKHYGFQVRAMFLGVFHPNHPEGSYRTYSIPFWMDKTKQVLEAWYPYLLKIQDTLKDSQGKCSMPSL